MPEQIPETELISGRWYVGRGRNGNVGLWNGQRFLVSGYKFDEPTVKVEPYYTETEGCFQPFAVIDEGVMVESFGNIGWDRHYGRKLELEGRHTWSHTSPWQHELATTWAGSSYLPDGKRIDVRYILNEDGTYEWTSRTESERGPDVHEDRGTWSIGLMTAQLIMTSANAELPNRKTIWDILDYRSSTMMLRWCALASRRLPWLFYRVHPEPAKEPTPNISL